MSTMFVIALDLDGPKAEEFLRDLQRDKRIKYAHKTSGSEPGPTVLRTLPLLFAYKTTPDGKCERHQK